MVSAPPLRARERRRWSSCLVPLQPSPWRSPTLHSFILHGGDVFKARRGDVPVPAHPFLPAPLWRMAGRTAQLGSVSTATAGRLALHPVPTHLRFLWSREELRRSRLLRSRLRLLFSRLRRFSPRQAGDALRLLLLFLSLSRSVRVECLTVPTVIIQPINLTPNLS